MYGGAVAVNGAALTFMSFRGLPAAAFYLVSGTSEASPQFAGIVAILDQALGHHAGLLTPTLYQLAAGKSPIITDVTPGNNTVTFTQNGRTHTVKGSNAGPGYDLASDLGSIDGGPPWSPRSPTGPSTTSQAGAAPRRPGRTGPKRCPW